MKVLILITCILANGERFHPRGTYYDWNRCNRQVEKFENTTFPKGPGKTVICWCHEGRDKRRDKILYSDDRKSPLP